MWQNMHRNAESVRFPMLIDDDSHAPAVCLELLILVSSTEDIINLCQTGIDIIEPSIFIENP